VPQLSQNDNNKTLRTSKESMQQCRPVLTACNESAGTREDTASFCRKYRKTVGKRVRVVGEHLLILRVSVGKNCWGVLSGRALLKAAKERWAFTNRKSCFCSYKTVPYFGFFKYV